MRMRTLRNSSKMTGILMNRAKQSVMSPFLFDRRRIRLFSEDRIGTFRDVSLGLVVWQAPDLQRLPMKNRKACYRSTARWARDASGWKETEGDPTEP